MNTLILSIAALLLSQCSTQPATTNAATTAKAATHAVQPTHATNQTAPDGKPQYKTVYTNADKTAIESLIGKFAGSKASTSELVVALARELRGTPYVAQTLEGNSPEALVVNLRQLDCTTYVENVLAAYLCVKNGKHSFDDFCRYLRQVRYANGEVSYPTRQHYFTEWIAQNTKDGLVREISSPDPPFSATQHLNINYMSTHSQQYPILKAHEEMIAPIAHMEKRLSGKDYPYIPKTAIRNTQLFRSTIHNGDIIAITTSKKGLDTSHIGIAVWHKDGLHMLNASQIHKKVVEEPMTLYQYMQKHPSQTGIRIIRIL